MTELDIARGLQKRGYKYALKIGGALAPVYTKTLTEATKLAHGDLSDHQVDIVPIEKFVETYNG